jgi:molecular chaperone GrpE
LSQTNEELKEQENQEQTCENQECCNEETQKETTCENKEVSLEEKVAQLEAQLKEEQDKFLRVHADFENIKKRLEREKYAAIDFASEKFAKDLLMPIDTLEMALAAEEAATSLSSEELLKKLKEGVELTIKNFYTAFEKHNISIVQTDSEFDPNIHNAIMQVASDEHENGQIVQVLQKGYLLKDRLLRPAMVSICQK